MGLKTYWVYIMMNKWNTVVYIGVTNDLRHRVWQHKNGKHDGFTKQYRCHKLVYFEDVDGPARSRQALAMVGKGEVEKFGD